MTEDLKNFSSGTGSSNDPYEISSQDDLMGIVSGLSDNDGYAGVYFEVTQDIKLDSSWPGIGTPKMKSLFSDMPYVVSGTGFAGTLDGNGHTITVDRTEKDKEGVGGLINYLAPKGVLRNLNVKGSVTLLYSEKPTMEEAVEGLSVVGGVVGYNCGTIDKVTSSVTVTTEEEYDTTGIPAHVYNVGGIAGFNDNYYVKGAVGVIRNCSNSGNVTGYEKVGGIAGENAGLIASCFNSGLITSTATTRSGSGGIAGRNGNNNTAIETANIWNCYNTGNIYSGEKDKPETQSSWIGGIAGFQNTRSKIHNCYDTGNLQGAGWAGYIAGSCGYEKQESSEDESYGVYNSYVPTENDAIIPEGGVKGQYSADKEITIHGKEMSKEEMLEGNFVSILNKDTSADTYGTWTAVENDYPGLNNNAEATVTGAKSWESEERTIYLDPANGNDGNDGKNENSPVKSLEKALNIATSTEGNIIGISNIFIMSTVTMGKGQTLYDSVIFTRYTGNGFTGPMFTINAPNSELNGKVGVTYVTFEGAEFDGSGEGTIFKVEQGRLRLRDSCLLKNAELGVLVDASGSSVQAQAELNEAWMKTTVAARVAGATTGTGGGSGDTNNLILNPFGIYEVRIRGVVELAADAYISVGASLSCNVTLQCASWEKDKIVARGYIDENTKDKNYALKAADAKHIYVTSASGDSEYCAAFAEDAATSDRLVLTPLIYLNGDIGIEMGTGTVDNPCKNLSEALDVAKPGGWIIVGGTTDVPAGSYTKNVVIRRELQFESDAPMFKIDANGGAVTLSNMTIDGEGRKIANVSTGTLELASGTGEYDNGVILTNSSIAVYVEPGATVKVLDAAIDASGNSIQLANASSKFTLTPEKGTSISGTVYLPEGTQIEVGAALTNLSSGLTVECQNPSVGLVIAGLTGGYRAFTAADTTYVTYLDGAYAVAVEMRGSRLVLKAVTASGNES